MTTRRRLVFVFALLAVPALAFAQPASNVRAGTVMVTGENPTIRLEDEQRERTLAMASFWRVTWSPVGPGHVCYVTTGTAGDAGSLRIALYDNEKLLEYISTEIMGVFDKAFNTPPFTRIGGATFIAGGDALRERTETCRSDAYTIELAWRDLQTPELIDFLPGSRANHPFGITYLRMLATTAAITINGARAPGVTRGRSSLAFGETWLRK